MDLLDLLDRLVSPRYSLGDATISDVDVLLWLSETPGERLGNGERRCLGIPSQKRHIAGVFAIIWGIILIVVVAGRWSEGGGLVCQIVWILTVRIVDGIWSVGRERWWWGCYDARSSCLFWFKSGRLTHVGANRTTWDALPVLRKGRGSENTRPGVVGENGRDMGPGYERSGTCTVEVHILDSGVEEEGEGSCGVRRDLELCTVRRRGSALDRSATTISDEQAEWLTMRDLGSHLGGNETSR